MTKRCGEREDSMQVQQYFSNADELERCNREKERNSANADLRRDKDLVKVAQLCIVPFHK